MEEECHSESTTKLFFESVWVHFGLNQTISSYRESRFISNFYSIIWSLMDTKLNKSIAFNPQIKGKNEVVNTMIMHIFHTYNSKHPYTWD